ncbi:MAG: hypothetical protein JRE64_16795 [Deltaproteobacteria bacterium]|nr:hypothetical protein [Deltaproteobacteria bacterium]
MNFDGAQTNVHDHPGMANVVYYEELDEFHSQQSQLADYREDRVSSLFPYTFP